MTPLSQARALALVVPAALMLGALGSQYIGGLHPCEMCLWQRWPLDGAIVFALFAFGFQKPSAVRLMVVLAALGILTSGLIGGYHAGVEYGWWQGLTQCSRIASGPDLMAQIMKTPLIRCDQPQWSLFGVSLAGFNALISTSAALVILGLLMRRPA